jgi:hypothetical protein
MYIFFSFFQNKWKLKSQTTYFYKMYLHVYMHNLSPKCLTKLYCRPTSTRNMLTHSQVTQGDIWRYSLK